MSAPAACYPKALQLLARRPHFRQQLARKLVSRGFPQEEVEATLGRLEAQGYLDDRRCALELASGPLRRKGFGPRRVRAELERRGAEEDVIQEAVSSSFPEGELSRARDLAARWLGARSRELPALARHLDRKGYSKQVIVRVLEDLEDESSEG
ncbi:MAG: regulatory protein RecX [Thermoanaerobaculia bacterium]